MGISGLGLIVRFGIATPDNEYASHKSACMSNTGRGYFTGRLQQSGGQLSSGDEVNVVPDLFAHKTTKEEKFAGGGRSRGKGVPISRER